VLAPLTLGVAFAADEHSVQALGPGSEHKPFGKSVGFWRLEGCLDNFGAYRSDHFVEGADELRVPVTDQETERLVPVLEGGY